MASPPPRSRQPTGAQRKHGTWTTLHHGTLSHGGRRAGGKPIIVDPKRTKIAAQADLDVALRPGTDVVFAWAVAAELERAGALDREFIARHVEGFEPWMDRARRYSRAEAAAICGVPESDIQRFAEWFRTMSPVALSIGNG